LPWQGRQISSHDLQKIRRLGINLGWIIFCLAFGCGIIAYPMVVLQSARRGLQTWGNIVLPSLLPFFVISDLLMSLGFVAILGTLLEPAMRPLFNLPGSSGFVFTVSYLSGFPLCAILTTRLRRQNLCTRQEGERLVAFTSNASPLFILGAVSVGMYHNPTLGPLIIGIHYLSNFICGLLWGALSKKNNRPTTKVAGSNWRSLLLVMERSSGIGKSSFGSLLGDTVRNATLTLLAIGAYITTFSVLIAVLQASGIFPALEQWLMPLGHLLQLDRSLLRSMLIGFFEITMGINAASQSNGSMLQQLMVIETLLAWNGLAVQAQVSGMMKDCDLGVLPYLGTRLLQVPMALVITYFSYLLFRPQLAAVSALTQAGTSLWSNLGWNLLTWLGLMLILVLASLLMKAARNWGIKTIH
jgi:sporulation integral membrane protein YlbJ